MEKHTLTFTKKELYAILASIHHMTARLNKEKDEAAQRCLKHLDHVWDVIEAELTKEEE